MDDKNLKKLEERKRNLEIEIARLQSSLDTSIDSVKEEIAQKIDPKEIIRKHPLKSLGLSVLTGFLLAGRNRDRTQTGAGALAGQELKRLLISRGIGLLAEYLDEVISARKTDN